ncbi:MAG: hypothetical protein KDC38_09565, partial [Planctomycetes bacterium]|nr:hypothetical protein [Planctomycetota bacterium]
TEDRLQLEDSDYWIDPWRTRREVQRPFFRAKREALCIGAPHRIGLDRHESMPLALLRVKRLHDEGAVSLVESAIVAAMELDSGRLFAAPAFRRSSTATAPAKRRGALGGDDAMVSEGRTVDLRQRLGIPQAPGRYLVRAFLRDRVSNVQSMEVVDSLDFDDPSVVAHHREQRLRKLVPTLRDVAPTPGQPLPSFYALPESPPLPKGLGITIQLPRVVTVEDKARCLARGSFRVPILEHDIVQGRVAERGHSSMWDSVVALARIHLLCIGTQQREPIVISLGVPTFTSMNEDDDTFTATGHFALDLGPALGVTTRAQTFFIHAMSTTIDMPPLTTTFARRPVAS